MIYKANNFIAHIQGKLYYTVPKFFENCIHVKLRATIKWVTLRIWLSLQAGNKYKIRKSDKTLKKNPFLSIFKVGSALMHSISNLNSSI